MLKGHGGNLRDAANRFKINPKKIIDFSASINPFIDRQKYPRWLLSAASEIHAYPDPQYRELKKTLGNHYGISPNKILPGNGSTEILYLLPRALACRKVLIVTPSYSDYEDACKMAGAKVQFFRLRESEGFKLDIDILSKRASGFDMVALGNPNNPTGGITGKRQLLNMVKKNPKTFFLIDEAFMDFTPADSILSNIRPNLLVLRSLTKFYAIPGLRIGFGVSSMATIKKLESFSQPWSINCVAEIFTRRLLNGPDPSEAAIANTEKERSFLQKQITAISGLQPYPSSANFILVKIQSKAVTAKKLQEKLIRRGFLIRDCSNFEGLGSYHFRISIRKHGQNRSLIKAISESIL